MGGRGAPRAGREPYGHASACLSALGLMPSDVYGSLYSTCAVASVGGGGSCCCWCSGRRPGQRKELLLPLPSRCAHAALTLRSCRCSSILVPPGARTATRCSHTSLRSPRRWGTGPTSFLCTRPQGQPSCGPVKTDISLGENSSTVPSVRSGTPREESCPPEGAPYFCCCFWCSFCCSSRSCSTAWPRWTGCTRGPRWGGAGVGRAVCGVGAGPGWPGAAWERRREARRDALPYLYRCRSHPCMALKRRLH